MNPIQPLYADPWMQRQGKVAGFGLLFTAGDKGSPDREDDNAGTLSRKYLDCGMIHDTSCASHLARRVSTEQLDLNES